MKTEILTLALCWLVPLAGCASGQQAEGLPTPAAPATSATEAERPTNRPIPDGGSSDDSGEGRADAEPGTIDPYRTTELAHEQAEARAVKGDLLCQLLDSRVAAHTAPFDGAVSLTLMTEGPLVDWVRSRAVRFARALDTIVVTQPAGEGSVATSPRRTLAGDSAAETETVPTAGTDPRIPVTISVQPSDGGAMLVFVPETPSQVGELTRELQRAIAEAESGSCDDPVSR